MSTPMFLLVSFLLGSTSFVMLLAGFKLLERLVPLGAGSRLRRLHDRRESRLARGHDRYFEELRSIDAVIAQIDDTTEERDPRVWYKRPAVFLLLPSAWLFGFLIIDFFGPALGLGTLPAWASVYSQGWFILIGLSYLLDRYNQPFKRAWTRLAAGALYVALGILMLSAGLSHSSF